MNVSIVSTHLSHTQAHKHTNPRGDIANAAAVLGMVVVVVVDRGVAGNDSCGGDGDGEGASGDGGGGHGSSGGVDGGGCGGDGDSVDDLLVIVVVLAVVMVKEVAMMVLAGVTIVSRMVLVGNCGLPLYAHKLSTCSKNAVLVTRNMLR